MDLQQLHLIIRVFSNTVCMICKKKSKSLSLFYILSLPPPLTLFYSIIYLEECNLVLPEKVTKPSQALGELYDQFYCQDGHLSDVFELGIFRVVVSYSNFLEGAKGTTYLQELLLCFLKTDGGRHGENHYQRWLSSLDYLQWVWTLTEQIGGKK